MDLTSDRTALDNGEWDRIARYRFDAGWPLQIMEPVHV
jgi:hypothetical protein